MLCSRSQPAVVCEGRREGQRLGHIAFSPDRLQWRYPLHGRQERPGVTRAWEWCPYCGGVLPDEVDGWLDAQRLLTANPEE